MPVINTDPTTNRNQLPAVSTYSILATELEPTPTPKIISEVYAATMTGFVAPIPTTDSNLGLELVSSLCTTSTAISMDDANLGLENELSQCSSSKSLLVLSTEIPKTELTECVVENKNFIHGKTPCDISTSPKICSGSKIAHCTGIYI